jgi:hypothetical protein
MGEPFFDRDIEPDAICGNCDYHAPSTRGQICCNQRSAYLSMVTTDDFGCGKFFPDGKRWPDADHG